MSFLQDVFSSLLDQKRIFSFERDKRDKRDIVVLCEALMSGRGEVSGAKITYDLDKEFIVADADDTGPVRMKFTPPEAVDTELLE